MSLPLRLLIVEDSDDDTLLLLRTLRKAGYDPESVRVENGPSLEAALNSGKWDCVISDYSLPSFNALDVLGILSRGTSDIPCIIVSGAITEEMAVAAMRAGANDYVMKDNLARLAPALARELQEAETRRAHRRSEDERHEAETRFRATFDHAAIGLAHVSLEGNWLLVNQHLCNMLGYSESELLTLRFHDIVMEEDLSRNLEGIRQVLSGEIPTFGTEKRCRTRSRAIIWVSATLSLFRSASGEPRYLVAAIEDISLRKETENLLEARREQVEALNERLLRAMRETHHRIKNNLQIISALLDMRVMDQNDGAVIEDLEHLGSQIRTFAAVHDILTEDARVSPDASRVSALAILAKLIPMIESTTGRGHIPLQCDDVRLSTHQGTTIALLANELILNAVKHGGASIEVSLRADGCTARLEVLDDGPGFPAGFSAADSAHTGLELVESMARWDLRGEIAFENRSVHGASVIITFPLDVD